MDKHAQVLRLDPSTELTFNGRTSGGKSAFAEVVTSKLRLDNPSDRIVYFKVKTTAPKHYCVRPNSGIIKPGSSAEINVLLQPVDDLSILEKEGAKHKFMIQSAFASNDKQPVDDFWKTVGPTNVMDSKLRVVFNTNAESTGDSTPAPTVAPMSSAIPPPRQPPSPTTAGPAQPPSFPAEDAVRQRFATERKVLQDENRRLQDQLNLLRQQLQAAPLTSEGGLPTVAVALLAIAMFLIGVILGKMI